MSSLRRPPSQQDRITANSNTVVLALQGELDLSVAAEARSLVADKLEEGYNVVIDLSGLEFVDRSGLVTLLRAGQHASAVERQLTMIGPLQIQVRRVLAVTGMGHFLDNTLWDTSDETVSRG